MMMSIHWLWASLALAALCHFLQDLFLMKKRRGLPPGPKGLPVIGSLHLLGKNPHQDLAKLAKKHGPIMYMRFGYVPTIIVSSPEAAEKFLKTYDQVFAGRPYHEASWYIAYEQRNLTFGQYGPYWQNMCKLCILQLLSSHKINSFRPMRRQEVGTLVKSLKQAASDGAAVDLSALISSLGTNMSCLMIFGQKYMDKDFDDRERVPSLQDRQKRRGLCTLHVGSMPNIGDYFPLLGVLDLQGLTCQFKVLAKVFHDFFDKIIDEHLECKEQKQTKDFVDIMMEIIQSGTSEFEFDRRHVKAVLFNSSVGLTFMGADHFFVAAILELLRHPAAMRKLQKELEEKVGLERIVEESDLEGLEYLDMLVKESMRLHPVGPLMLPHEFKDSDIDLRGQDFRLTPFGSGRRICPGL
ncbi:unnamed protein product [Coffea canephora]|uniref:Cytochrome P450 n=1 Tax=Coffea canephora TaxID=49390 RepID=A0A068UXE4_COFCA|nr:unnamed protein product [Coffea canephora]